MSNAAPGIYIGTVLMERNRWAPGREPSFRVSDYADRFAAAGFDGVELWENHACLADSVEQEALGQLPCPVRVYNSYVGFEDGDAGARGRAAEWITRLGATAVKYNVGRDAAKRAEYMANLRQWRTELPAGCALLCECHGGTILETPAAAETFFGEADLANAGLIVHALSQEADVLREWFSRFGPAIKHLHLACRNPGGDEPFSRLAMNEELLRERFDLVAGAGFRGTITIEFTAGVATADERPETLLETAIEDLRVVRANVAR